MTLRGAGRVRRFALPAGDVTVGQAADTNLATLRKAGQASTHHVYGRRILVHAVAEFGSSSLNEISAEPAAVPG
jgi:hypothetical protein